MSDQAGLPLADALPVHREATIAYRIARWTIGPLMRVLFRIRVEGRANLPSDGPFVIVANHLNWLDPFMLLLALPPEPRVHFLANPVNLVKHPIHWWIVRRVGGYIPVDLSRPAGSALFLQVHRCLKRRGVVAIFPEASYGDREGQLRPFKKGFAHFAIETSSPVLPIALSGTKDLWLGKTIRVVIGEPINPHGREVETLVDATGERLASVLPSYHEPKGLKLLRRQLTHLLY